MRGMALNREVAGGDVFVHGNILDKANGVERIVTFGASKVE